MAVRKREGWRKEIGVAIAPKRGRSAVEEEEEEEEGEKKKEKKKKMSAEYQM
jgi:hypothetical protein